MSGYSAAGQVQSWDAKAPKWVDLMPGIAYAICVSNPTDNDVDTGTITVEVADEDPNTPCRPGPFATFQVDADCAQPIGVTPRPAVIELSVEHPIPAHMQCSYAFPCPKRFARIATGSPATLDIHIAITRLKRTGMGAVDASVWPWGYMHPYSAPIAQPIAAQTAPAPVPRAPVPPPPRQRAPAPAE